MNLLIKAKGKATENEKVYPRHISKIRKGAEIKTKTIPIKINNITSFSCNN